MTGSPRLLLFIKLLGTTSMESCVACLIIRVSLSYQSESLERCGFLGKPLSGLNSFVVSTAKSFIIIIFVWNNFSQVPSSHKYVISLQSVKLKPFLRDI